MALMRFQTAVASPTGFRWRDLLPLSAILGLPLAGAMLAGRDIGRILQFPPPLAIPRDYLPFSWLAIGGVGAALAAIVAPWFVRRTVPPPRGRGSPWSARGRFPWWGQVALVWTLACWFLAWTRWPWFEPFQRHTFFPLWFGFIVVLNAWTQQRTGSCLLRRAPQRWLALFGLSALFWWIFEWLNRFVENWHYLGVEDFDPVAYGLHASLCFSTVLPAVAAVAVWLDSFPSWRARTATGPAWRWLSGRRTGCALIGGGAVALLCTGMFPRWLYPALWVAPLALFLGASILRGEKSVPAEIERGDWRRAASWMVAALICGVFWELWNWHSLAKWIYTVPGVERWHFFEMPLAGYAGYLPFGLECLVLAERVADGERNA